MAAGAREEREGAAGGGARRGVAWGVAAVVLLGAILRFAYNDVEVYSPADEAHHVAAARAWLEGGLSSYSDLVQRYLRDRGAWAYPSPVRWGYLGMAALACAAHGSCDGRALAWLSAAAGVACIALTYLLGARLVGRRAALLAAALAVTSPLQLALSRRALSDEVSCAAFLLAAWALVRLVQRERPAHGAPVGRGMRARDAALFVAAAALAFAVKEVIAFAYVGLVAAYLLARRRALRLSDALVLAAPPAVFFLGFVLLSGSPRAFVDLLVIGRASFLGEYSAQYQSGPPHRPLFDLFVLAPVACLLAAAALVRVSLWRSAAGGAVVEVENRSTGAAVRAERATGASAAGGAVVEVVNRAVGEAAEVAERQRRVGERERARESGARAIGLVIAVTLIALMGLPKNVRFAVVLDPLLRLLAAWTWVEHVIRPRARGASHAPGFEAVADAPAARGGAARARTWALRAAGLVLANAAAELPLFHAVFIAGKVYDPTTQDVLRALGALPRPSATAGVQSWPFLFFFSAAAVVAALAVAMRRSPPARLVGAEGAIEPGDGRESEPPRDEDGSANAVVRRGAGTAREIMPGETGRAAEAARRDTEGTADEAHGDAGGVTESVEGEPGSATESVEGEPGSEAQRSKEALGAAAKGGKGAPGSAAPHSDADRGAATEGPRGQAVRAKDTGRKVAPLTARERVIIGVAAACVVGALFAGRACGSGMGAGTAGTSATSAPADPAAAEVSAGLAAADPEEAVRHFRAAIELYPGHYGATFQLARALDRAGRAEEAYAAWERVLRMADKARDQPLADMARARLAQGDPMAAGLDALHKKRDPALAAARFREVLARTPEHYGATFQLATALEQAGRPAEALPVWEKMLALAEASGDTKTVETARARIADLQRALGTPVDPDADAMREAVEALYTKSDPASAVTQLRAILARTPGHYGATFQLATALDRAGKQAEARPVWEKMLALAEASGDTKTAETARARLAKKP